MNAARDINWSLQSLFDRDLDGACPLATTSKVIVKGSSHKPSQLLVDPDHLSIDEDSGDFVAEYKFVKGKTVNVGLIWDDPSADHTIDRWKSPLTVHRHLSGFGQERGGFGVEIHNYDATKAYEIKYFEAIPWYLKLYLHTMSFSTKSLNGTGGCQLLYTSGYTYTAVTELNVDIVRSLQYQPAKDRVRPTVLELALVIPSLSHTTLKIDFDKAFIKYAEHPPDANRGFDVG
ncbi:hypothetical protein HK101_003210 [Irineochytrium annulatum]|nr:hypothetical protein HK101_003210 [Irineochytrium annulatum]